MSSLNFIDATLIRLADATTRANAIDSDALAGVAGATYDASSFGLSAPYAGIYDEFELGIDIASAVAAGGYWIDPVSGARTEARFEISGLAQSNVRIDALWTGSVSANVTVATSTIESVPTQWPNAGTIDDEIRKALGALPADTTMLETERRTRYLTHLRAGMDQPALLTDAMFDASLQLAGATTVGEIVDRHGGGLATGTLKLVMSVSQPRQATMRQLPVKTAILIRDAGTSIADLLHDSKVALTYMRDAGLVPRGIGLPVTGSPSVLWMLPAATFDDPAWPGADNAARHAQAAAWLAPQHIALAPIV